jgi:hypothetical protein
MTMELRLRVYRLATIVLWIAVILLGFPRGGQCAECTAGYSGSLSFTHTRGDTRPESSDFHESTVMFTVPADGPVTRPGTSTQ